jgi:hypothetical protein
MLFNTGSHPFDVERGRELSYAAMKCYFNVLRA